MSLITFLRRRAYLDWASAAPVHPRARAAFLHALRDFANPSSFHDEGQRAKAALEESRTRIARLAGAKPRSVIFTSGATEANALAIQGRMKRCRKDGMNLSGMHALYLPTMHSSVRKTLKALEGEGLAVEAIPLSGTEIDIRAFERLLRPETVLVCADAVCAETGTRFDTLRLKRAMDASKSSPHAALHVDASQLPLAEKIERTRLGADLMTLDAQKAGGIRGVGALVLSHTDLISSLYEGGGQEEGLRPGTEPVALIAAFAEALAVCQQRHEAFSASAAQERARLAARLAQLIPEAVVHEARRQAPHILTVSLPGMDTDYAVALLDREGFAVSTRSACESDSAEGSNAILALTGDPVLAASTVRVSWGPDTGAKSLQRLGPALAHVADFLRNG
jgi:cysteine desulfurase